MHTSLSQLLFHSLYLSFAGALTLHRSVNLLVFEIAGCVRDLSFSLLLLYYLFVFSPLALSYTLLRLRMEDFWHASD